MPSGLSRLIIGSAIAQTGLVIVGIMAGGDLDDAGAEGRVDQERIGDDRDLAVGQGQVDVLADQVFVARVVGMNGHGRVAQHGLGPGGGDVEDLAGRRAGDRVLDRPEMAGDFFVIDLVVGHGGAELGVPVDQPLAAKDLARLEQVEKRAADCARAKLVEGEPGPLPVAGTAHQPELAQDPLLVLVFPGPDSLDQGLAAQVVAGLLLLLEQPLFDDGLGGDAGVVGAGHPEDVVALHPPPADQDVLQRVIERVAQVEGTGDVRRRDHDAVGRPGAGRIGVEIALFDPELVKAVLGVLGVVLLGEVDGLHSWAIF